MIFQLVSGSPELLSWERPSQEIIFQTVRELAELREANETLQNQLNE